MRFCSRWGENFPTLAISANFEKYKNLCAHTCSIYCIYRLYTHVHGAIQIFVYIKWPKINWSPTKQWSTLHRIWGNNDSMLESFEYTPGLVFKYGVNHLHFPPISINCVWKCNMFNMFAFSTVIRTYDLSPCVSWADIPTTSMCMCYYILYIYTQTPLNLVVLHLPFWTKQHVDCRRSLKLLLNYFSCRPADFDLDPWSKVLVWLDLSYRHLSGLTAFAQPCNIESGSKKLVMSFHGLSILQS